MTFTDFAFNEGFLGLVRQFQQAHGVGHCHTAFANSDGNFFVRQVKFISQLAIGFSSFKRREVGALHVFDQRQFEPLLIGGGADDHGDFIKTHQPGCLQASFTGDKHVCVRHGFMRHDQRLNDAVFADGIRQVLQIIGVH